MSRTCWSNNHVNQPLAPPGEAVLRCTCGRSPDFNVHLPSFMDFSPTELPTTGSITTGSTTSEIPSTTSSAMPTTLPTRNATTLGYTSIGLSSRTMTPVTRHEQEAGENSASTLTGATPHTPLVLKSTTYVFLRTPKPTLPTDNTGLSIPSLENYHSVSPYSASTARTETEGSFEDRGTGFNSNSVNQTSKSIEEGKGNDSKDGSRKFNKDVSEGTTENLPLDKTSKSSPYISPYPSPQSNISPTNTIPISNPSNTSESVTNADFTNPTTNDAVTPKKPSRINRVTMATKSSSNTNSRTSSTSVKSRRSTSAMVTSLSSSVFYSSVSSSSSAPSSGGIHVSSRITPAPHPNSSVSPGLNSSRGGFGGKCLV
ncbi:flocculation protein FLO11-like [Lytechinus variegatus]|uniref:flocculation protein FLO11-like n=1 Tax=Lytechinus variegatus TaxID=7654 RepID=UPI001BB20237|nr:flocculation protein FLO11-like [Lytechinus variegatus]